MEARGSVAAENVARECSSSPTWTLFPMGTMLSHRPKSARKQAHAPAPRKGVCGHSTWREDHVGGTRHLTPQRTDSSQGEGRQGGSYFPYAEDGAVFLGVPHLLSNLSTLNRF